MAWYNRLFGARPKELELEPDLEKAIATPAERMPAPKHWDLDPQDWQTAYSEVELGQVFHPGTLGLDFDTLRAMSRVPVISAIIQTRVSQVAEFAVPVRDPYSLGYRIRLVDADAEPNRRQQKEMKELSKWLLTCGD